MSTKKQEITRKKWNDKKVSAAMTSKKNKAFFANLLRYVRDGRAVTWEVTNGTQNTFLTGKVSRCSSGRPTIYFSWPEQFGPAPQVGASVEVTPVGYPRFV